MPGVAPAPDTDRVALVAAAALERPAPVLAPEPALALDLLE